MDSSTSREEVVLEFVTAAAAQYPSTTADLSLPANNETVTNEVLTAVTADEPESVMSAVEDVVSSAAAEEAVNGARADAVDELTVSSSASDARKLPSGLSKINSTLQGFETLRLEMLSRLETADRINEDEYSTTAEEDAIIRRLLKSLKCGIEEIQANIVHI